MMMKVSLSCLVFRGREVKDRRTETTAIPKKTMKALTCKEVVTEGEEEALPTQAVEVYEQKNKFCV